MYSPGRPYIVVAPVVMSWAVAGQRMVFFHMFLQARVTLEAFPIVAPRGRSSKFPWRGTEFEFEFSSLMAWGKKLLLSLSVFAIMLHQLIKSMTQWLLKMILHTFKKWEKYTRFYFFLPDGYTTWHFLARFLKL